MKLVIIGLGQCGGRIADHFARLNRRARVERGIDIITGAFAVNTDMADLSGLVAVKSDFQHRILIGNRKTGGHGVGKINELGAEIAKEDGDKVLQTVRASPRFQDTDAFLLVASTGGGTGSGAIAVVTQMIKEHYIDKPVYNLLVLPFEHEETTEERTIYNTATCLKSTYLVADAVFLFDNQRFLRKDTSVRSNLARINAQIAQPFYNLLCAGEEKKPQYIGAKILDAGDIIQTIAGWTVLGYSSSIIPLRNSIFKRRNFRNKAAELEKGFQAMNAAISSLSLKCNPVDSKRALYLVAGPPQEISVDLIRELGVYLRDLAPEAVIRSGDYPREKGQLDVSVVFSELSDVEKIRSYFTKTLTLISALRKRQEGIESKQRGIEVSLKDIPSLL